MVETSRNGGRKTKSGKGGHQAFTAAITAEFLQKDQRVMQF